MKYILIMQKLNCQNYLKENSNNLLFSWFLLHEPSKVALLSELCNNTNISFWSFECLITLNDKGRTFLTKLNYKLSLAFS